MNTGLCLREMETILTVSGGKPRRVFPVYMTPVERKMLPERLRVIQEFEFYHYDHNGRTRDIRLNANSTEYWARIDDLAQDLSEALLSGNSAYREDKPRRLVYLAETTSDLRDYNERNPAGVTRSRL